jgi:hypothetical protein
MDAQDLFEMTLATIGQSLDSTVQHKDWLASWRERMTTLQADRRHFKEQLAKVVSSDELTEKGRQRRIGELQASLKERLKAEAATLQGYEQHLQQLRSTAKRRETPSELGQVLDYLRGQELRAEIRKLDPIVLRGEYESRAHDASGRYDEWLRAVEESPVELLPGEVLDKGKESRLQRSLEPQTRQQVSDLEALHGAYTHLVGLIERELPAPDPIAEMAQGSAAASE